MKKLQSCSHKKNQKLLSHFSLMESFVSQFRKTLMRQKQVHSFCIYFVCVYVCVCVCSCTCIKTSLKASLPFICGKSFLLYFIAHLLHFYIGTVFSHDISVRHTLCKFILNVFIKLYILYLVIVLCTHTFQWTVKVPLMN